MRNQIKLNILVVIVILFSCKKENNNTNDVIIGDSLSQEDNNFLDSASVPNPTVEDMIGYDGAPLGLVKESNNQIKRQSNTQTLLVNLIDAMLRDVQSLSAQKTISHSDEGLNKPQHMGLVYSSGQRDITSRSNPPFGNSIHKKYAVFGTDCSGLMINLLRHQDINIANCVVANFESTLKSALESNSIYKDYLTLENLGHIPENETKSGDFIYWIKPDGNHIGIICNLCICSNGNKSKVMFNSNGTGTPSTEADQTKNLGLGRGVHPIDLHIAINGNGYWGNNYKILRLKEKAIGTITDIDGNVYNTVTIGTQVWMKENLKSTHYNDGTAIPTGLSDVAWQNTTSGAYAIYEDNPVNNTLYGKLYNWYAVNTGKLAPIGWHVPTQAEWDILINYLGGENDAGQKMKATTLWMPSLPDRTGTNASGFSGLPGGDKYIDGSYYALEASGWWWSAGNAWRQTLGYDNGNTYGFIVNENQGFSVRCIKN